MTFTVVLAVLLAACASSRGRLPALEEIEPHAALDRASRSLPNETGRTLVGVAAGEPLHLGWRHTKGRSDDWLIVFVHGVLADRWVWTFVAGELGPEYDLLLVDLPGCGASDKPDPGPRAREVYCPTAMGRWVYRVIEARLATYPKRPRVALVGHSLGTMVVMRMLGAPVLLRDFTPVHERIDRAVLLSAPDFAVERIPGELEAICDMTALLAFLGEVTGVLDRRVFDSVYDGATDPERMPRCVYERRLELLRNRETRVPVQHMLRNLACFTEERKPDWDPNERCVRDYGNVQVPCLLISGARDGTICCAKACKIGLSLPHAWIRILPRVKHAVHIDRPIVVAAEIRLFLERGGEGRPKFVQGVAGPPRPRRATGPDSRSSP